MDSTLIPDALIGIADQAQQLTAPGPVIASAKSLMSGHILLSDKSIMALGIIILVLIILLLLIKFSI